MIGITAMILPGLSGSFLLLILGKYAYVTGALKAPFVGDNFQIYAVLKSISKMDALHHPSMDQM